MNPIHLKKVIPSRGGKRPLTFQTLFSLYLRNNRHREMFYCVVFFFKKHHSTLRKSQACLYGHDGLNAKGVLVCLWFNPPALIPHQASGCCHRGKGPHMGVCVTQLCPVVFKTSAETIRVKPVAQPHLPCPAGYQAATPSDPCQLTT